MSTGEVKRELVGVPHRVITVHALQRFSDQSVKAPHPRLTQLRVEHLLQQRMGEVVTNGVDVPGLDQHALSDQLVEGGNDLRLVQAGYFGESVVRGARPDDSGEVSHRACAG